MAPDQNPHFESFLTRVSQRRGNKISKPTFKRDERIIKFLVYLLSVNMKKPARMVSRIFTIHHETVAAWVEEVAAWPDAERNAIASELITGRSLPEKDVLDDKFKVRPISEVDQYEE